MRCLLTLAAMSPLPPPLPTHIYRLHGRGGVPGCERCCEGEGDVWPGPRSGLGWPDAGRQGPEQPDETDPGEPRRDLQTPGTCQAQDHLWASRRAAARRRSSSSRRRCRRRCRPAAAADAAAAAAYAAAAPSAAAPQQPPAAAAHDAATPFWRATPHAAAHATYGHGRAANGRQGAAYAWHGAPWRPPWPSWHDGWAHGWWRPPSTCRRGGGP